MRPDTGPYAHDPVVGSAHADLVVGVDRRPGAGETVLGPGAGTEPADWMRGLLALGPRSVVVTLGRTGRLGGRPPHDGTGARGTGDARGHHGRGGRLHGRAGWRLGVGETWRRPLRTGLG
jgi:hypothetical protein